MGNVPRKVYEALEAQRRRYPFYITAKEINGRYYVYREYGEWDSARKKERVITEYLGRIAMDGTFIKKKAKTKLQKNGYKEKQKTEIELDDSELRILTALSMNSRASISKIAGIVEMNDQAAYRKVRELEKKLKIKYIIESNLETLGYTRYLLLVKFTGRTPSKGALKKAVEEDPRIGFAVITRGDYDLVMYFIDKGYIEAIDDIWEMRSSGLFGKYSAEWHLLPFGLAYSFVPLRMAFIEKVMKKNDLGKSLTQKEFEVFSKLHENGVKSFFEIDKECRLTKGSARHAYLRMLSRGIIVRPTIKIENLPMKYLSMILLETLHGEKVLKKRYRLLSDVIQNGPIANKYALGGNVGNPAGTAYFMPVIKNGELEIQARGMEKLVPGISVRSLIVTDMLVGEFCYRRYDNEYSRQYKLLVEQKKLERTKLVNYGIEPIPQSEK